MATTFPEEILPRAVLELIRLEGAMVGFGSGVVFLFINSYQCGVLKWFRKYEMAFDAEMVNCSNLLYKPLQCHFRQYLGSREITPTSATILSGAG